ncbi:ABC-type antimicrobial peptide transport system, ATPase component [Anaerolinea thermolimosa]|nr:ABC-type antimicrobial peptide transport system, ATPase component [Anaerolinea thermolimosa]
MFRNTEMSASLQDRSEPRGEPVIRVKDVRKAYPTAGGLFYALKGVSFEVKRGEFLAITGKSGAGKTTLVNMVTGTDQLTAGEVWVGAVSVHQLDEDRRARWRGENVGVIYQSFHLMPMLTLLENVMLPMDFCGLFHPRESRERAYELLKQVELADHAYKLPSEISGGQQQRVAIARALANDPMIIVADEPTGRLDTVTAGVIFEIFRKLAEQGKTILMVTHDRQMARRVDRLLTLHDGVLVDGNQPA